MNPCVRNQFNQIQDRSRTEVQIKKDRHGSKYKLHTLCIQIILQGPALMFELFMFK